MCLYNYLTLRLEQIPKYYKLTSQERSFNVSPITRRKVNNICFCPPFAVVALLFLSSCPVLVCCEEFFWNGVSDGFFLFAFV